MSDVEIRDIGEADISSIVHILNNGNVDTFANTSSEILWKNYVHNPNQYVVVAEIDGSVIGTASLLVERKFRHGGSAVGHIEDVAVEYSQQDKGVGMALIKHLIAIGRREGCYKVVLDCAAKNIPFYIKCGFEVNQFCMRINPGTC